MTSKDRPGRSRPGSAGQEIARAEISAALHKAMADSVMSHEDAARVLSVDKRTVGSWLRMERPVNVEAVLGAPRLAKAFRRGLCGEHHRDPVGYVAKKRGSK